MDQFSDFATLAREAVLAASPIVSDAVRAAERPADVKMDGSLVTQTDLASQEAIAAVLHAATPQFGFYAEETAPSARTLSDFNWIVDPLDGTHNFHFGFPMFAIQVALEHRGHVVAAAMSLPMENLILHAWRGGGSYANGRRISVSKRQMSGALMLVEPRWTQPDFDTLRCFKGNVRAIRVVSSSCISLAYIALGRADLLVDWDDKPWDLAAGTLLVEEAGGRVTDLQGGPFRVYDPRCLASNGVDHDDFIKRVVASRAFEFLNSTPS